MASNDPRPQSTACHWLPDYKLAGYIRVRERSIGFDGSSTDSAASEWTLPSLIDPEKADLHKTVYAYAAPSGIDTSSSTELVSNEPLKRR